MEIEFNPLHIMIRDQQERLHCAETEHIALVRAVGVHARIMVVLQDGTKYHL